MLLFLEEYVFRSETMIEASIVGQLASVSHWPARNAFISNIMSYKVPRFEQYTYIQKSSVHYAVRMIKEPQTSECLATDSSRKVSLSFPCYQHDSTLDLHVSLCSLAVHSATYLTILVWMSRPNRFGRSRRNFIAMRDETRTSVTTGLRQCNTEQKNNSVLARQHELRLLLC